MTTLPVSLIQMHVTEDKAANLRHAADWIALAADAAEQLGGSRLVMLPEMFCCPYDSKAFPQYCEPVGGAVWQALGDAARKNAVTLVGGSMPEEENGRIYNTCFIFNERGEQIGRHRKMHLFDIDVAGGQRFKESDTLSPGNDITVVETAFGKLGVAICYDVRFPELARLMALQGAKVLAYPGAFNMTTGPAHWEILFRTRALDNQVFTLGCAPARNTGAGYISYANSIAVSPWGKVIGRLEDAEGCLTVKLDFDEQERARREIPVLQHRRTDIYALAEKVQ